MFVAFLLRHDPDPTITFALFLFHFMLEPSSKVSENIASWKSVAPQEQNCGENRQMGHQKGQFRAERFACELPNLAWFKFGLVATWRVRPTGARLSADPNDGPVSKDGSGHPLRCLSFFCSLRGRIHVRE